jgi:hypothetical protein
MRIALIADPDLRERVRCTRVIASQTTLSAIGAGTWEEVLQAFEGVPRVEMILYAGPLSGEPAGALAWLDAHANRLVVVGGDGGPVPESASLASRPIAEERLILLARAAGGGSAAHRVSFAPVDFLQMVTMSGDTHTLVVAHDGDDVGIIEVHEGRVWTAFDALGVGDEAFARLIRPEMRCRVSPKKGPAKARTIFKDFAELVMDSLVRLDQGTVVVPPPLSARRIEAALASPEDAAAEIKRLTGDARRLLMERSYDEAARALIHLAELDPESALVRANLEQLRKLGYPR